MVDTLLNVLIIGTIAWFVYQRFVPARGIKNITTSELKFELNSKDKKKQFIDVRTPSEFKVNHINGFKNIPLFELHKRANELSKDKEVFVICQSGMRSSKASKLLKKLGFKSITNVKGGIGAWRL
ncbi:rhodanese-like domain-containing protein [Bacillus sp. B1-b2]|uniref:rhodanese-like domain-containing protein n=1 Tax=Bacillus sp. B1-b2 TaxID=2653201 RepID=UPI000B9AAAFF|nr:rhodanese-like domain-containing protein [Bacillus sp. B1-b2]KAB7665091.1 rhodanese-like domain-containing protein [Bacillus sp. B1-b2]OXT17216.1 rhodanese [Bacillus sp. OG2]